MISITQYFPEYKLTPSGFWFNYSESLWRPLPQMYRLFFTLQEAQGAVENFRNNPLNQTYECRIREEFKRNVIMWSS